MSVEKLSNRAVYGAAFWRAVGALASGTGYVLDAAGAAMIDVSKAAWMLESHHGRRYEAALGIDLAVVVGEPAGSYSQHPSGDDD